MHHLLLVLHTLLNLRHLLEPNKVTIFRVLMALLLLSGDV